MDDRKTASSSSRHLTPASCLTRSDARDTQFAGARRWGPGYYNYEEDDGRSHVLGFQFSKKGRWSKRRFCYELWFPEDQTEPVQVLAYFVRNGLDDSVEATQSLDKLTRKAALDRSKLLAFVGGRVKQWKVHL